MPFQSKAQSAYMHANHPEIAKRWDAETPQPEQLPQKVGQLSAPPPMDRKIEAMKALIDNQKGN